MWLRTAPTRLNFDSYAQQQTASVAQKAFPQRMIIGDLSVDLPLYPSSVVNNTWETTTKGASYLRSSPLPGEKGNSIIYGHNWLNLLGPLVAIKPGETIEIAFSDNSRKRFVVDYTSVVNPNESSILAPSQDNRITVYTCTGFLDSKRFVAVATLK
jgi:LPXTG-site transpeptidase (sortase) family protein